jgi:hypothetical protein
MPSLLTAVLGLLLVGATVIGIVTTAHDHSRHPAVGPSGIVLYGGR